MKVLEQTNTIRHGNFGTKAAREAIAKLIKALEAAVGSYIYVLSRGCRLVIEVDYPGYPDEQLRLDLQADQGGGSFAKAKMETLKRFPDLQTSGMLDLETIKALVNEFITERIRNSSEPEPNTYAVSDDYDFVRKATAIQQLIGKANKPADFSRNVHEWIRDSLGITAFNGGIRCEIRKRPTVLDSDDDGHLPTGEIRAAFSGAAEHEDLVISIIATILTASAFGAEIKPLTYKSFLGDDPHAKFLIDWKFLEFVDYNDEGIVQAKNPKV